MSSMSNECVRVRTKAGKAFWNATLGSRPGGIQGTNWRVGNVRSSRALRLLWLKWRGGDEKDGILIMAPVLNQAKC